MAKEQPPSKTRAKATLRSSNSSQTPQHTSPSTTNTRKRNTTQNTPAITDPKAKISKPPPRNPKDSHLYTDDNPSTTLHGTGFKDATTATRTLTLIARRSLTYQWQVVNTMYHRAKSHPAMKKGGGNEGMKAAMDVFRGWLDGTYVEEREKRKKEGREWRPLVGKEVVGRYVGRIEELTGGDDGVEKGEDLRDCKRFARVYVGLEKGKRLANVLMDDEHPEREDWEVRRERALVKLSEERVGPGEDGLWNEKGGPSDWHLRCIGWAWSPVGERRLPP